MTTRTTPAEAADELTDLVTLLPDWRLHLRAANRAPNTITSYVGIGVRFAAWLHEQGMPRDVTRIRREHVEAYVAAVLDRAPSPATAAKHYRSLQQLFRWLVEDGELTHSPMERMRPPAVPEKPVPVIAEAEMRSLLATTRGNTFENRRDAAVLRVLFDTGVRSSELLGITVADLDFDAGVAQVLGKGRRPRAVPFGAKTAEALRRYLRARARHPLAAATPALWIGKKGPLSASGLAQLLDRRAADAEVGHFTRTSFATPSRTSGSPMAVRSRI